MMGTSYYVSSVLERGRNIRENDCLFPVSALPDMSSQGHVCWSEIEGENE